MIATQKLMLSDLARQRRVTIDLAQDELTARHRVAEAIELYLERSGVPGRDVPYSAFSRGRLLDKSALLGELPEADVEWLVVPEISAG